MNILTFDVENWFESSLEIFPERYRACTKWADYYDSFLEANTEELLDILKKHSTKATFFVLGSVAIKHPQLVRRIAADGHEIAAHGMGHVCVYKQKPDDFKKSVLESIGLLESVTGSKVLGFRAPYFSVTRETMWVLDFLKDCGLRYDSSIFPFKRGKLYGINDAVRFPYKVKESFWEFPLTTIRICNKNIPIGGGYCRILPFWLVKKGIKEMNKQSKPAVFYLHPYEINPRELNCSFSGEGIDFKLIKYSQNIGRRDIRNKLNALLEEFSFTCIRGYFYHEK